MVAFRILAVYKSKKKNMDNDGTIPAVDCDAYITDGNDRLC